MSANRYPLIPSKGQRAILAVLATAHIMQPALDYNGLLTEDVRVRLPRDVRKRLGGRNNIGANLHSLKTAGYVAEGATRIFGENGIYQSWSITATGMRAVLGVLG